MIQFIRSLYFHQRFYVYISLISGGFLLSFWWDFMWSFATIISLIFSVLLVLDIVLLFRFSKAIKAKRLMSDKLSNSDKNEIVLELSNLYPFDIFIRLIDELPFQFQIRDFAKTIHLKKGERKQISYTVKPTGRGVYEFGNMNVYASSRLKMISRRYQFDNKKEVAVYPSYMQMKKYEFLGFHNNLNEFGLKKIRRIGHTMEFEQIKNYVVGDDVRTINWKATAKKGDLMVNQYQDEKSQPIYSMIDIGRVMKMPFNGLKLLDYSINSSLAFSNIALLKNDKAGMLTFSKKVENRVVASNKKTNLSLINEVLYKINTDFTDSDFGLLYATVKRTINQRSFLILYTNFEHISALKRQLPYLKALAKKHLLLVVFFENTELDELIKENAEDLQSVYNKAIAQNFSYDKKLMVKELNNNGIYAILTKPEELSVNVINKYLQFKSKGLI